MKLNNIILCLLLSSLAYGQNSKLKKADEYYNLLAYSNSAKLYKQLLGTDVDTPELRAKLADSYYKIGEITKSEESYRQMILADQATSENYYNYAQVLKQNAKYKESDIWMKKFEDKVKDEDLRAKSYKTNKNYLNAIESQEPFFSIKHLNVNTPSSDFGGYSHPTSNQVYFVSSRTKKGFVETEYSWTKRSFLDIYSAVVDAENDLTSLKKVSKVNTKFHEGPLCFSPDGKFVYFTRNNISKGKKNRKDGNGIRNLKLYRADITADGELLNEEVLPFSSKDYSIGHPSISGDGKTLYFSSDMPGGFGGSDIYSIEIKPDGSFGTPVNLGDKINTEGQEMFPWVNNLGNLFFSSDGLVGLGGLDVFCADKTNDAGFGNPINVGKPINSNNDDFAFSMKSDNKTGYFSSNRYGGNGDDDIYSFTQIKPIAVGKTIKGTVYDQNKTILADATVNLYDKDGVVVNTTKSDVNGNYSFVTEPDRLFSLIGKKSDYTDGKANVSTTTSENELLTELILEKDPGLSILALITDKNTGKPLEDVEITIIDNISGDEKNAKTNSSGEYRRTLPEKKINDRGSYNVILKKEGYFTKTLTYNTVFDKPGIYEINSTVLSLEKEVKDLAEMVKISPINFDLNKYVIRKDAQIELDKIVEIMNRYPDMVVELGAHTDCRGSKVYNEKLSDKRAIASAAYIKTKISNPERIYGKGYGESRLLNECGCEGSVVSDCPEEQHDMNRRTEFRVISSGPNVRVINTSSYSFEK
jgi:outer membrane protein OmpA-like peptidoglycan-associated protein/tetratricopeptide (TPR) repeat protein